MNTVEQVVARYTEDALESFGIEQAEFKKHAKFVRKQVYQQL